MRQVVFKALTGSGRDRVGAVSEHDGLPFDEADGLFKVTLPTAEQSAPRTRQEVVILTIAADGRYAAMWRLQQEKATDAGAA